MSKRRKFDFSSAPAYKIFGLARQEAFKHSTDGPRGTTYNGICKIMQGSKQVDLSKHGATIRSALYHLVKDGVLMENEGFYTRSPGFETSRSPSMAGNVSNRRDKRVRKKRKKNLMPPNSSTPDVLSPTASSPAVLPPNTFNTVVLSPNSSTTTSVDNNATANAGRTGKRKRFEENVDSNRLDDDDTRTSSTALGNPKKKHVHKPV